MNPAIVLVLAATPIPQMLHQIDARRVEKTVRTLVAFGTRNTLSSQEDPEHVDDRRKEVGLEPLADYTKTLCEMYKKKS